MNFSWKVKNKPFKFPFLQDNPIQKTIDSGDMEQLAMLVLNGEGKILMGKSTTQPDIQAFIDNVPTYMVS